MATPTSNAAVTPIANAGDNRIDTLTATFKWSNPGALTYSFQSEASVWSEDPVLGYDTPGSEWEPWNPAPALTEDMIAGIEAALDAWAAVADIDFTPVTDSDSVAGDIRFGATEASDFAHAYLPNSSAYAGDVWFGTWDAGNVDVLDDTVPGGYGYLTIMHEIGHALGLTHTHDTSIAGSSIDSKQFTVMTYRDFVGQDVEVGPNTDYYWSTDFYPTTPMLHDVLAIQYLYGANTSDVSDSTYQWALDQQIYETIWDAGGDDTISWANQSSAALVNLNDGEWSKLGDPVHVLDDEDEVAGVHFNGFTLAIAYGAMIENALGGSGNDTLIGNEAGNFLEGGDGNDSLIGNSGADWLEGGAGNDSLVGGPNFDTLDGGEGNDYFVVNSLSDVVIGGGGSDTISSSVAGYVQPDDVEFLFQPEPPPEDPPPVEPPPVEPPPSEDDLFSGDAGPNVADGGNGADTLLGNDGDDSLTGGPGADSILGGVGNDYVHGNQGADTLRGALGNDELRGGQDDDVVYSGQGDDQALGALGADELRGGPGNDTIQGGQGNDTLFGGEGNDFLQPRLGNDVVTGGAGADTFWFNIAGATDADTILDFVAGEDKIQLDPGFFTDPALVAYEGASGQLSYNGQLIVTLSGNPAFTNADLIFAV